MPSAARPAAASVCRKAFSAPLWPKIASRRPCQMGRVDAVREGVVNALVVQNPFQMGYGGVDTVIRKIREGEEPGSQDTGVTLVTEENVDDPEVQAVLNPSCDNPPT